MELKWNADGLIPAVAQDAATGRVLMLAWMNEESLRLTRETGFATYYSRSRKALWRKGETSGHTQKVREILIDCDGDALLLRVDQIGPACHTGTVSCFSNPIEGGGTLPAAANAGVLTELAQVVRDRREHPKEGSYTNYLFDKGLDKICKKVGEEATEVVIAAKNGAREELRWEIADLIYHMTVLMEHQGLVWEEVFAELEGRKK